MNKKVVAFILAFALLGIILGGCGTGTDQPQREQMKELVFASTQTSPSIDPADGYSGWFTLRYGIGETLFKLDSAMEPVGWLADNYDRVDELTWKIHLRDNITFQNGKPMTGDAVKASLERTLQLNDRAPSTLRIAEISVEGQTLTITTSEPNPTLINGLADPFACIIDVKAEGDITTEPVGTGPYKVKEFVPKTSTLVTKYEDYWNGKPKLDQVKIITISDGDTMTMALQSGQIDASQGMPYSSHKLFENNPDYKITSASTSRVFMVYYNFKNKFLNNPNVRKAISLAIDKESYSSVLLNGSGEPAVGAFPAALPYGSSKVKAESFNLDKAKALLEQEGFKDSDGDGILDKDGEKLSFKLVTYSSRVELPILSQALQSQLKALGIEVQVEVSEDINNRLKAGDFDLAAYAYVTTPTGDPLSYLDYVFKTDGVSNFGRYSNPQVDELIEELRKEFQRENRSGLAIQIQQLALDETAFTFMAHLEMAFVMKANVVGLEVHPTDYYQINVDTDIVEK
ncbi:MAG: ABC transporter substrate-binding protein [Desulfitobacterium sp.]|nr:ABC transporter substrate-binding protein [Desulfitobacterium sp.]